MKAVVWTSPMVFAFVQLRTLERLSLVACADAIGVDIRVLRRQAKAMGLARRQHAAVPPLNRKYPTPTAALAAKRELDREWQNAKRRCMNLVQLEARRASQRATYNRNKRKVA